MYNAATPFHVIPEVLFWSWLLVLPKAKVRASFYTGIFYTNPTESEIGTLTDLKEKETFLVDIRLASDWITAVYQRVYRRSGHLLQLFSDQKDHN